MRPTDNYGGGGGEEGGKGVPQAYQSYPGGSILYSTEYFAV